MTQNNYDLAPHDDLDDSSLDLHDVEGVVEGVVLFLLIDFYIHDIVIYNPLHTLKFP